MADHLLTELDGRADLVEKCMPSYPPYGKRILLDNGWFATVRKPNVELVVDSADHVDATGVVADGQHREHDIVVLANGFEVFQGASRLGLRGRGGIDLADLWADDDPMAYLGITVADFPNFFIMQGPPPVSGTAAVRSSKPSVMPATSAHVSPQWLRRTDGQSRSASNRWSTTTMPSTQNMSI